MNLNQAGIDLIKQFEGCKLHAYPDPATGGEPITIGFGHTGGVKMSDVITVDQAIHLLTEDLNKTADKVRALLKPTISDNKFSALVCFAYNVGIGNFAKSSMLSLINAGNSPLAAYEFSKWCHANGKTMPGLIARRDAERKLFES